MPRCRKRNPRRKSRKPSYSAAMSTVVKTAKGRQALARFRKFWGVKHPPEIKILNAPGVPKNAVMVGMGTAPGLTLADGPKHRHKRTWRQRLRKSILVCTKDGRRMMILSGRSGRGRKRFVGFAAKVEYIPNHGLEAAKTFKTGKHWIHSLGEEGGTWPKVFTDGSGNYTFGPASYRIGKWIRN